jgi:hypothetical protein
MLIWQVETQFCILLTGVRLGKLPAVRNTLFCRCCSIIRWVSSPNSQTEQAWVITDVMRALWSVSLMLVLNVSLLNRAYSLINVLKALASVISMSGLLVIFLLNITPRYFTLFTNGMFYSFSVRRDSGGLIQWGEVDCPSLVFIDFNVAMLTPGRVGVFWECSPPWALSSAKRPRLLKVRVTLRLAISVV